MNFSPKWMYSFLEGGLSNTVQTTQSNQTKSSNKKKTLKKSIELKKSKITLWII